MFFCAWCLIRSRLKNLSEGSPVFCLQRVLVSQLAIGALIIATPIFLFVLLSHIDITLPLVIWNDITNNCVLLYICKVSKSVSIFFNIYQYSLIFIDIHQYKPIFTHQYSSTDANDSFWYSPTNGLSLPPQGAYRWSDLISPARAASLEKCPTLMCGTDTEWHSRVGYSMLYRKEFASKNAKQ